MITFISTSKFERWWRKAQGWFATQFASINVDLTPIEDKVDEVSEKLDELDVHDENAEHLAQFFGLPEALPEYTALTPAEAIAIARDCQYNVMGTDWPIPTWLPTGVTEAQVESAAEGLGIPYHEPTQTA